jgi:hypothetical protein
LKVVGQEVQQQQQKHLGLLLLLLLLLSSAQLHLLAPLYQCFGQSGQQARHLLVPYSQRLLLLLLALCLKLQSALAHHAHPVLSQQGEAQLLPLGQLLLHHHA